MQIVSTNGKISFGQQFDAVRPQVQTTSLDHLITSETMKKTYPFSIKVSAVLDGQEVEDSESLNCHYCIDLHKEVTQEEYDNFKRNYDPNNIDERIFFNGEGGE